MRTLKSLFALAFLAQGCPIPPPAFCGDGALDTGEGCDDGNATDTDGCHADCSLPACGDGVKDPGEVCVVGPVEFEIGEGASGIVVADFNKNGDLDIATANTAEEAIGILFGDGSGGFSRGAGVQFLGAPFPLVTADFDNDGDPDLATSLLSGPDSVPVVRGDGLGGFSALATLPATAALSVLVVGDFDGDGNQDAAGGDSAGGGVSLFLNSGEGGFVAPRTFVDGVRVSSLVAGDFDGDGTQDLAVAIALGEGLLILRGDGAGSFTALPTQDFAANELLAADFNNDGFLDLAAGRTQDGEVALLLGAGDGSFGEGTVTSVRAPLVFTAGDFNGDGNQDLAAVLGLNIDDVDPQANLALFVGDGRGGLEGLPLLPLGFSFPKGIVAADFNEDGLLDVALTDEGGARVQVLLSRP